MALQVRLLPDALVNLKCDEQFGPFVYWHRTAAPQAAKAGSIPARVALRQRTESTTTQTTTTKWWNWQTRDTQNVVPRGRGSSTLPLVTSNNESSNHAALFDAMTQGGQCPVGPHKLHRPGATPGPATDRTKEIVQKRPSTQTGKAAVSRAP
jgi:hypothetical protein